MNLFWCTVDAHTKHPTVTHTGLEPHSAGLKAGEAEPEKTLCSSRENLESREEERGPYVKGINGRQTEKKPTERHAEDAKSSVGSPPRNEQGGEEKLKN